MTPPRAFGADQVRIGRSGEIELLCPFAKSWTPRGARTLTRAEHPGTAVEWDGRIFEVLEADPTAEGGMRYRFAAWEDRHAIRRLERYDEVSETIREGDRRGYRLDAGKRRLAILFAPLTGLLPAGTQKKMERDFGAPALKLTIASALPLFLIGFLGLVAFLVENAGAEMDLPGWIAPSLPIAAYLFCESTLRLASAIVGQEPMGSLPVALAFAAWQSVRRPNDRSPAAGGSSRTGAEVLDEQGLQDRFRVLEPVLAFLPVGEQEFLARRFGFDAVRWGRITAAVLLAASALNTLVSLSAFGSGDGLWSVLWLLPVGYLAVEQVRRLKTLARGDPAASVLGRLVRPFARPLLAAPAPVDPPEESPAQTLSPEGRGRGEGELGG
jgi:hypothetical protein